MMFDVLNSALNAMTRGPRAFEATLDFAASTIVDNADDFSAAGLLAHLKTTNPGDDALGVLRRKLGQWDNEEGSWAGDTERNTAERREAIYAKLSLSTDWIALCDDRLPFHPLERATVIATEHTRWYSPEVREARAFYWPHYVEQLKNQGWIDDSLTQLDDSTTSVVERLADPTAEAAYQSKGLVVGYVQSGKTANFTGVLAKAADAGYKLIIVMGGILDVLRSQTQRRIDKELIGRELLADEYINDPDYDDFVSHGGRPSTLGAFDWYRLTGPDADYQGLKYGREALKFEGREMDQPFWAPDNLYPATTRIAVVKKNSKILNKLANDLRAVARGKLGVSLDQVPVLIIDDESDQASINVAKATPAGIIQERTATNKATVALLTMLPRAQYIGYTATPSANVLVDPAAEEDIFPKDFLISLPRPDGYMGVSDFYDLDKPFDETGPNEEDFVRPVKGEDDKPENLAKAIDTFVLSGAIKLYRGAQDQSLKYRHHTMLAHVSQLQADHKTLAALIRKQFAASGYNGGDGLDRLAVLFEEDFRRVYERRGAGLPMPDDFAALLPYVGECLSRIGEPAEAVIIVNNDHKADTPDFDRGSIWKVLVGGAKLSRGYTVEGLTVSYYRRRAGASDTLMQMGRWFGFRRGYKDLVRLFIGTEERDGPKSSKKTVNLYEAFGAICRDEEVFRQELERYAEDPEMTPARVPPLVPVHMLRPTSANKMRNAVVTFRNFGGELAESTFAPTDETELKRNITAVNAMVSDSSAAERSITARVKGSLRTLNAVITPASPDKVIAFLEAYRWYNPNTADARLGNPHRLPLEFLKGKTGDPEIDQWLILSPKIKNPRGVFQLAGADLDVVFRSRHLEATNRFNTYNDPVHRAFAEHITGKTVLSDADDALAALTTPRTAVMILYPITDAPKGTTAKPPFNIGFTLLFPKNGMRRTMGFKVRQAAMPPEAIVFVDNDDDA
ncbi:MAG: endonuclease [Caulobacter sp.]|nr:endonuclease [Caulobacter sp.]